MSTPRRTLIAGNWKMNGTRESAVALASTIQPVAGVDIVICPPSVHLGLVQPLVTLGAQDVSAKDNGAFTGEISAAMLKELGCLYVIVGHSERREHHGESDALVRDKAAKAIAHGLIPIICVGETLAQREAGETQAVIARQMAGSVPQGASANEIVIAYEPVWAIGTGLVASIEQIAEVHAQIRGLLPHGGATRILYGGSVKPDNARDILGLEDVDGALVGGASLKAESFLEIIKAAGV